MYLIDLLNWFGKRKRLKLAGKLLLFLATRISFSMMVRIAGRRIVTAFAGAPAMLLDGLKIKDTVKDPRLLYKAMAYTVETMGLDTLCLFADMSLEAEACGCQVHFDDDRVPSVITHPVKTVDDITGLRVPDPYQDGRMPVFLEAMRLMKKNYTMLKAGEVCGPFTLATNLGGTDIYMDVRRNPQKVKALLEYCEKVAIRYAQALIKSGADIILIAEPAGSQLSASAYEDFSLSYTKNIIKALDRTCILHICGKAGHLIEKMCQSGAAVLSIDDVDMAQVIERVPRGIVIAGNISPQKFSKSSPEELESATLNLLDTVKTRKDFLVAPGCDLSPQTPLENVQSFVKTVKTNNA